MATIGSLSARILADADGFKRGMGLTRNEVKLTQQAFLGMASDTDKLNVALQMLESARAKGAPFLQDAAAYAAAIQQVRNELDPTIVAERARVAPIEAATQALDSQIATHGLNAEALQLYQLKEAKATDTELFHIAALQAKLAVMNKQAAQAKQLADATAALTKRLNDHIETVGMSADQIELHRLKQLGATDTTLDSIKALQAQKTALQAANRADQEAIRIKEQMRPGVKAYVEGWRQAKSLLDAGKISTAEYTAEKRRLASLLPAVQAKQEAVNRADQEATRIQEQLIDKHQERLRELRKQIAAPWADGLNKMRDGNLPGLSAAERLRTQTQGFGQVLSATGIPGLQSAGNALATLHPAVLAVNTAFAAGKVALTAYAAYLGTVTYAMRQQLLAVNDLALKAAQLQMPIQEFTAMDRAARMAGIETDQLAGALGKLTLKVGEAASGNPEAVAAFKRLGLEWQQLVTQNPSQQMGTITAALQGIASPSERAAAASKLFGEEVRILLPLLNQGSVSMRDWLADAEQARLIVSDADAANVRAMFQEWTKINDAVAGIVRQAAVELAPVLKVVAGDIAAVLQGPGGDAAVLYLFYSVKTAAQVAAYAVDFVRNKVQGVVDGFTMAANAVRLLELAALGFQKAYAVVSGDEAGAAAITAQMKATEKAIVDSTKEVAQHWTAAGQASAVNYVSGLEARTTAEKSRLAKAMAPPPVDANAQMVQQIQAAAAAQQQLREQAQQTTSTLHKQREAVNEWADSLAASMTVMLPMQIPDPLAGLSTPASAGILDDFAAFQESQKPLQDALDETTKRLQDQARTAGMTAEQLEIDRLQQLGATPDQLAGVAVLQQRAKALRDMTAEQRAASASANGLSAATRGSSEAMERVEAYRKMLASKPRTPAAQVAPAVPPIAAGITPTWTPPPAAPAVPPIAAGITPTWTPPPAAPILPPIPAAIEASWGDILGTPPMPTIAASQAGLTGTNRPTKSEASDQSATVILGKAVALLQRIANATEKEPFTIEQMG